MTPVTGFLMAMHHGHDQGVVCFEGVQHRVRKHACQAASHILFQDGVTRWLFGEFPDRCRAAVGDRPARRVRPRPARRGGAAGGGDAVGLGGACLWQETLRFKE